MRQRGEALSPHANNSSAPGTSPDYYFDADGKSSGDLAKLNLASEPLEYTAIKTKFTEVQESCLRSDIMAFPSMIDVPELALGRVLAFVAN